MTLYLGSNILSKLNGKELNNDYAYRKRLACTARSLYFLWNLYLQEGIRELYSSCLCRRGPSSEKRNPNPSLQPCNRCHLAHSRQKMPVHKSERGVPTHRE